MFRLVVLALLLAGAAHAQPKPVPDSPAHGTAHAQPQPTPGSPAPEPNDSPHSHRGGMMMGGAPVHHMERTPTETGQSAFAAIKEVVGTLEADPHTDWSKVDIDALRQHLIDMDEVTLHAAVAKRAIPGGLQITVTGHRRTLQAIHHMLPDQARQIDGSNGMRAHTTMRPDGVELTVTSADPAVVARIRGLGFMGIMVQGSHHQVHHLAIARGEGMPHH